MRKIKIYYMFKELIFTFSNFDPCLIYKIVQSVNLIINMSTKILKPPFNEETARAKVKAAQDAWNSRNPELVAQTYTIESRWRNRTELFTGREAIIAFLKRKWTKELDYSLMKELWCYTGNRISVRFEYEWRDAGNPSQWMRTHGNEHWQFDDNGLMRVRDMSANDYPIKESERRYR
jgi:nuclear transport factor 2 (NTF2) superfamily protein